MQGGELVRIAICFVVAMVGALGLSGSSRAKGTGIEPGTFPMVRAKLDPGEKAAQAARLEAALGGLRPQRPGVVDTYVLTVSLWNDPVFESEATQAASILAARFDAVGRTITLSVGVGEGFPSTLPLARPDTLTQTLNRLGAVIDPDEDLVVVFITSHGMHSGEVALQSLGETTQGAMTPGWLSKAVDTAGISTSLMMISACYSGSFVPEFDGEGAVLFTAASADRPSFGCEPSRNWTYFGDALFNHGLRSGADITVAQAEAARIIAGWEAEDALDPSQPQRHLGGRALERVRAADAFGRKVLCVADLRRIVLASKPAEGSPSKPAAEAAISVRTTEAETLGVARGYTPAQVLALIEQAASLPDYGSGAENLGWRATQCVGA